MIIHVDRPSRKFSTGSKARQVDNDVMSKARRKFEDYTTAIAGSTVIVLEVVCEEQMVV